ncbi:MAG: hypothetical protein F4Z40_00720 [Chloroflexi bacterium]|nr:hypothetical protein [Chloroflexota bacterium]
MGRDITFSTSHLEYFSLAKSEPVIFDAMLIAASVEYADFVRLRDPYGWPRKLSIKVPVEHPSRWEAPAVTDALHDALRFVTGDYWAISFCRRKSGSIAPTGKGFDMLPSPEAVVAYSDGMDSFIVTELIKASSGSEVVRVRVGGSRHVDRKKYPSFVPVPYRVAVRAKRREPTARSRGFKFALVAGIAAYLLDAKTVVVPESGQGALGPQLIGVGHAYSDFRNNPLFMRRMERLFQALLEKPIRYAFPRLWSTKGQTLETYASRIGDNRWQSTKSCWRDNRWSSVNNAWRHCGVCAACMLRRVSVHAAGLTEPDDTYICTDMRASTLESAVESGFKNLKSAFREYAIAGVRHMDDMAGMADSQSISTVRRCALSIGRALHEPGDAEKLLAGMLERHAHEWSGYLESVGANSFVNRWVGAGSCQ